MEQQIIQAKTHESKQTYNTARHLLEILASRGVRAAFGIPGGLISPVYDALADVPQIQSITTRHEGMAGYAAMGHTILSGEPAIVLTTSGPGLTNAITGIASAYLEEIPLIAIAGEVPTTSMGRGGLQDSSTNAIDAVSMLRTVTRWSARIESPQAVSGAIEQAIRIAKGPRPGPVFLSLPLDVSSGTANRIALGSSAYNPETQTVDMIACREVADALRHAKRPLIVAGNGARFASIELRELIERLAIPVITTPHAKGVVPENNPLYLGGIGLGGHPSALEYLQSAPDVVLIIGSKLGDYATNGWSTPISASTAVFQIDREPWLIGRNYPVTMGIVGDSRVALRAIIDALPNDVAQPQRNVDGIRVEHPEHFTSDSKPLKAARVLKALQDAFPGAFWACDQGEHCAYAIHYLRIHDTSEFRTMVGFASMGSGIGLAIGAKQAMPNRHVIGICGDGCFAMHAGELLTCVEHKIGTIFAVFNDGRYNMVHHGFQAVFGRKPTSLPSRVVDLAGVAREFGAIGIRIENPEDLDVARLQSLATLNHPVVLDIRMDASLSLSANSRSAALRNNLAKQGEST